MPARIAPLDPSQLPDFEGVIEAIRHDHGYVPNSFLTLGRHPAMLHATGMLADALWYDDRLTQPLRRLTGFAYSWFSGVMYSAAHLAHGAEELGLPLEKLLAMDEWETADVYSESERAVLRFCRHAARMPNELRDEDVTDLWRLIGPEQTLMVVGVICWHAFLNRWNMIVSTELEPLPLKNALDRLAPMGWHIGPH
jgi:hypothetical protein